MEAPAVHESFTSTPILFRAAPDAPLANSLVDLRLKHENKEKDQLVQGSFAHNVSLVYEPQQPDLLRNEGEPSGRRVVDSLPFKVKLPTDHAHRQERVAKPEG